MIVCKSRSHIPTAWTTVCATAAWRSGTSERAKSIGIKCSRETRSWSNQQSELHRFKPPMDRRVPAPPPSLPQFSTMLNTSTPCKRNHLTVIINKLKQCRANSPKLRAISLLTRSSHIPLVISSTTKSTIATKGITPSNSTITFQIQCFNPLGDFKVSSFLCLVLSP